MGLIADQLKARIEEMKVRHAESDRKAQESLDRCFEILAEMRASTDAMLEEIEDA